jgi:hypothetical protein
MYKKLYSLAMLVAAMFFATACQSNEDSMSVDGSAQVAFALELEGEFDASSVNAGVNVDQLMYAVFNESGSEVIVKKEVFEVSDLSKGVWLNLTLPKGNTYKAVFWAQNSECDAYSVSDDMKVTVDYDGLNNDETRDAFYGVTKTFRVDNYSTMSVVLKRPFAQVNVGADEKDAALVENIDMSIAQSSAVIKGVANKIDLFDGSIDGCVDVEYSAAPIPGNFLFVDGDYDGVEDPYEYVSMCYVLAGKKSTIHEMAFKFLTDDGKSIELKGGLFAVPLLRNWRTNIIGQVYSGSSDVNIKLSPEFEGNMKVVPTNTGVYYNVTEDMTVENTVYFLDNINEGATFASESGQLITMNNVRFYGDVWTVVLGEYRGPKYFNYRHELNNVVCKDLTVSNVIYTHGTYVSVGTQIYGKSTINNCVMKGTTTVSDTYFDGTKHDFTPVDVGIPNECDAVFNGGEYGTMFFWEHAVVTLNNVKADRIISLTCNSTNHSQLTIAAGTKIGVLDCVQPPKYGSRLTIEEGASVDELNLVSSSFKSMSIAPGTVKKITYNGVEYTLEELMAMQ